MPSSLTLALLGAHHILYVSWIRVKRGECTVCVQACKSCTHTQSCRTARATALMCHSLSSLWRISIWKRGGEWVRVMCQELTQLITATERMAKSSGDLITWNNCRCSSSSPLAAINLYDFPLGRLFPAGYLASENRSQRFQGDK